MVKKIITPRNVGSPDFVLLLTTLALLSLGIVMVFSSSVGYQVGYMGTTDVFKYLKAQAEWACIGIFAMILLMNVDHKLYKRYAPAIMLLGLLALVLVYVPGLRLVQRGSARWLKLGPLTMQPSETIKLALSIFLAAILAGRKLKSFKDILLPLGALGVCAILVVKQPDLGTTLVIAFTAVSMLFAAGMSFKHFMVILALGGVGIAAVISKTQYMMERLEPWIDPWAFAQGKGYQTVNALLALGSGGVFGTGLGRGMQKFGHVPENHTDMIFAIIGEELGLIGTTGVILLFVLFVWRGLSLALHLKDPFSRYLTVGITCMIGFQALINLGVVTGLLPVTGVTLPFISYGGSSLTLNLAGVGILLNISRYSQRDRRTQSNMATQQA